MYGNLQASSGAESSGWLFLRVPQAVAMALRGGPPTATSTALQRTAKSLGLNLEQRIPGADHPALQLWFRVALPSGVDCREILKKLTQTSAVEAGTLSLPKPSIDLFSGGWTLVTPV